MSAPPPDQLRTSAPASASATVDDGLLRDIWYLACPASDIQTGALCEKMFLGEPVVMGRTRDGKVFALRDICPHRAAPLSAGRIVDDPGKDACVSAEGPTIECPYHGWRFGVDDGACKAIPSLVADQAMETERIKVRHYPVREQQGLIWIFMPASRRFQGEPGHEPPMFEGAVGGRPKMIERDVFSCHVDHAVVGLMDPAHGPFVHKQWWWRTTSSAHDKAKKFEPRELGFAMAAHAPSSNSRAYKILGGKPVTEITFRLPGVRWEHIKAGEKTILALTAVTPRDKDTTDITQFFFWDLPVATLLKPLLRPFASAFLRQDGEMVDLQQKGLAHDPNLMLIDDADVQAKWYQRLKKEWTAHQREGRDFVNPIEETVLRWRS